MVNKEPINPDVKRRVGMKNLIILTVLTVLSLASGYEANAKFDSEETSLKVCKLYSRADKCLEYETVKVAPFIPVPNDVICIDKANTDFKVKINFLKKVDHSFRQDFYYAEYGVATNPKNHVFYNKTMITTDDILTRTHTGKEYLIHTTNGAQIILKDVDYSVVDYIPVGFHGTYIGSLLAEPIQLDCEFITL